MLKRNSTVSRLIHLNFSTQVVTDAKNYSNIKEFCHILHESCGLISSSLVESNICKYIETTEYDVPMVLIEFNLFMGDVKSLTIYIPKGQKL